MSHLSTCPHQSARATPTIHHSRTASSEVIDLTTSPDEPDPSVLRESSKKYNDNTRVSELFPHKHSTAEQEAIWNSTAKNFGINGTLNDDPNKTIEVESSPETETSSVLGNTSNVARMICNAAGACEVDAWSCPKESKAVSDSTLERKRPPRKLSSWRESSTDGTQKQNPEVSNKRTTEIITIDSDDEEDRDTNRSDNFVHRGEWSLSSAHSGRAEENSRKRAPDNCFISNQTGNVSNNQSRIEEERPYKFRRVVWRTPSDHFPPQNEASKLRDPGNPNYGNSGRSFKQHGRKRKQRLRHDAACKPNAHASIHPQQMSDGYNILAEETENDEERKMTLELLDIRRSMEIFLRNLLVGIGHARSKQQIENLRLVQMIEDLESSGVICRSFAECMHNMRKLANKAAHANPLPPRGKIDQTIDEYKTIKREFIQKQQNFI